MVRWTLLGCISDMASLMGGTAEGVLGAGMGEDMVVSVVREDEGLELEDFSEISLIWLVSFVSTTDVNCCGAGESLLLCFVGLLSEKSLLKF